LLPFDFLKPHLLNGYFLSNNIIAFMLFPISTHLLQIRKEFPNKQRKTINFFITFQMTNDAPYTGCCGSPRNKFNH
jgi:hypothetical protein